MSAFIVSTDHIDALLTAALAWTDGGRFNFYHHDPVADQMQHFVLTEDTAGHVGAVLLLENQRSVDCRYSTDDIEPPYIYRALPYRFGHNPDPVTVLKAIGCYAYQSCEHDAWRTSVAKAFCDALRSLIISKLPGYDEAPAWEVRDRNIFQDRS